MSSSPPSHSAPPAALPWRHLLLALAVVAVWGTNFVVVRIALDRLPPLLLATLRFAIALLPALFLKRPPAPWRTFAAYGVLIGAGQFGLLFIAMNGMISPGLASLVVQSQVFFTIGFAMVQGNERVRVFQILALLLATAGIGVILAHADRSATPLGLGLTLLAALCWAGGNQVTRTSGITDMLGFVVWSSLFAIPPLLAAALLFEGPHAILAGLQDATLGTWAAVIWQAVGNTLFGYAAWAWLLSRHPAATITPMAMLVPVFGMSASTVLLGETLPAWKLAGAGLVMAGLAVNILWPLAGRVPWRRGAAG